MKVFSANIQDLRSLYVSNLKKALDMEQKITKALPDMIEKATDQSLKNGFETHLAETKGQIVRLEKVFQVHGVEAMGVDCPAIDGVLKEASEVAGDVDDKAVLDAAIVANSQAIEHYEISRYGTLIAWAEELGHDDVVRLLTTNLNEEKAANTKLNSVALRKSVNKNASAA